jgi:hypothetical protein
MSSDAMHLLAAVPMLRPLTCGLQPRYRCTAFNALNRVRRRLEISPPLRRRLAGKTQRPRDHWKPFTVITTDPNEVVEPLHNRMPVILQPKDYDRWLTPGDPERPPVDLLRPFPAEQMTVWKVDRKVGK